jgi:MFS family permease
MMHSHPKYDPEASIPHLLVQESVEKVERDPIDERECQLHIKLEPNEIPMNWPSPKKWSATIVVVLMTATISFGTSIHASAIGGVSHTFDCSKPVATLGITMYLIGFAMGPLLFAPLSEVLGRCLIFRIILGLFVCFNVGCALAPNIESLLILRFLCGFFGSPAGEFPRAISNQGLEALTFRK